LNPQPKIKNFRSRKYLDFIKTKPSLKSGQYGTADDQIVPAHQDFGACGTALKSPDIYVVPLLASEHHEEHHGAKTFWGDQYEALPLRCLEYINEFLSEGGKF